MTTSNMDNLYAGQFPEVKDVRTIATGQTLVRGTCLGTAAGLSVAVDKAALDDSANFDAVLLEDVTTTSATQVAPVALTGSFNSEALVCAAGTTVADIKAAMRAKCCFVKDVAESVGV